jgi:hypothetical protein
MEKWRRRIKAAIGLGLTWAFAWFAAGMVLLFIVGFGAADVPFPLFFGLLGFFAGATFSGVLGLLGRRRRFDQMSLPRFAVWGALGGVLLAGGVVALNVLFGDTATLDFLPTFFSVFGVAGAASAAGTLALARMAEDPRSLEAGEDVANAGLTERERRELLGD